MTKRNHEINAKPGLGHASFPDVAQVTATQTVQTVPAGVGVFEVVAVALTGDIDIPVHRALRVIDVHIVKTAAGGTGDTITVKNTADAITNAIDGNAVDKTVVRAGTIDDAFATIAAGGTLRVSGASAETSDVFITVAYLTD